MEILIITKSPFCSSSHQKSLSKAIKVFVILNQFMSFHMVFTLCAQKQKSNESKKVNQHHYNESRTQMRDLIFERNKFMCNCTFHISNKNLIEDGSKGWRMLKDGWKFAKMIEDVESTGWRSHPIFFSLNPFSWIMSNKNCAFLSFNNPYALREYM